MDGCPISVPADLLLMDLEGVAILHLKLGKKEAKDVSQGQASRTQGW